MKFFGRAEHSEWMKSHAKRAASGGMLLENDKGQVLIVKANYKPYWTFPGGFVDSDETPKTAALRETLEEVGLVIAPESTELYVVINRVSDVAQTYQFVFKAPLDPGMTDHIILQKSEIDEWELVDKQQVLSGDRKYGLAVEHWANNNPAIYVEQIFEKSNYGQNKF